MMITPAAAQVFLVHWIVKETIIKTHRGKKKEKKTFLMLLNVFHQLSIMTGKKNLKKDQQTPPIFQPNIPIENSKKLKQ